MSGGASDKFNYYASVGVDDQEGTFANSSLKRYSGRLNLNQKALDGKLNVDFNLSASRTLNNRPDAGATVADMLELNPTIPLYTNGEPTLLDDNRLNPLIRNEIYADESNSNRILANISPSVEIVKGLTYKLNLGVDYSSTNRDQQRAPYALLEDLNQGYLNSWITTNQNTQVDNTLTYTFEKGDHGATVLVGHSYQEVFFQQKKFELQSFADNGIDPRYQDQISSQEFPTSLFSTAEKK